MKRNRKWWKPYKYEKRPVAKIYSKYEQWWLLLHWKYLYLLWIIRPYIKSINQSYDNGFCWTFSLMNTLFIQAFLYLYLFFTNKSMRKICIKEDYCFNERRLIIRFCFFDRLSIKFQHHDTNSFKNFLIDFRMNGLWTYIPQFESVLYVILWFVLSVLYESAKTRNY